MSTETESTLRIQINDMIKKLSQLKSNVDLYTQVRSLQQELQHSLQQELSVLKLLILL